MPHNHEHPYPDEKIVRIILARSPNTNLYPNQVEEVDYVHLVDYLMEEHNGLTQKLVNSHFRHLPAMAIQYLAFNSREDFIMNVQFEAINRFTEIVQKRGKDLIGHIPPFFVRVTYNILREKRTEAFSEKNKKDNEDDYRNSQPTILNDYRQKRDTKESFPPNLSRLLKFLNVDDRTIPIIDLKSEGYTYPEIARELNPKEENEDEIQKIANRYRQRIDYTRRKWLDIFGCPIIPNNYKF